MRIAVIGAGAAGLVAARACVARGHSVRVFESNSYIGGVWKYVEDRESDLEFDVEGNVLPPQRRVSASMYRGLRTNLPKEVMGFSEFPFPRDHPRFMGHKEVQRYLEEYAEKFELRPLVSLAETVKNVSKESAAWTVETSAGSYLFDAIAVCSGHYAKPFVPQVPHIASSSARKLHSHSFRNPEEFEGKRVMILGKGPSASDIAQLLHPVASSVRVAARGASSSFDAPGNIHVEPWPHCGIPDDVDVVIFATGYEYNTPFLPRYEGGDAASWTFAHVFLAHDPSVAFIGLPWKVTPLPLMERQAEWMSAVWSGAATLPESSVMVAAARAARQSGVRAMHFLGGPAQWEYLAQLRSSVHKEPSSATVRDHAIERIYNVVARERSRDPQGYRATLEKQDWGEDAATLTAASL